MIPALKYWCGTKPGLKWPTLGSKSSQEKLEEYTAKKKDGKKRTTGVRDLCNWLIMAGIVSTVEVHGICTK